MANSVTFKVGYQVDKTALNDIKASLLTIQRLSLKDFMDLNKSMGLDDAKNNLNQIKNSASQIDKALSKAFNVDLGTINISKFNNELKNSGVNINDVYKDFSAAGIAGQSAFRDITTKILTTNMQLKQSHELLDQMATTLKNSIRWTISSSIINNFTGSVQEAYGYVKNLDNSLNDIRIVTGKSADEMANFAIEANKAAQSLAASTTDYTRASLIYYQQGLSDEEVAARTDVTLKAANVTQQSTAEVSEQLTAVWNGYKVSAAEAELYVDKLAAVAASTASDLEELSTGMSRVASAAALMGVDVNQLNAQLSTIISVTRQAPESVGTALRSIYARMSDIEAGLDGETTLGNYTEEMLQYGINVLNANEELRDMGEVIEEVGNKWANMTREQQVGLSQAMAGTRQYNNLLALFDNWDNYTEAIETSRNAVGTLQEQQDIYMESTQAHLQQLETAQEDLFDSLLDADTINTFADVMTKLTKTVTNFVDALGGGKETLLALGSIATRVFSNQLAKGISTLIQNFKISKDNATQLRAEMEIISDFKGAKIDDSYLSTLIDMKKEIIDLNSFISEDQANAASEMIKQTNELNNQKVAWEENLQELSQYFEKVLGLSKIKDFDVFKSSSKEFENFVDTFDEVENSIDKTLYSLEKFKKLIEQTSDLKIKKHSLSLSPDSEEYQKWQISYTDSQTKLRESYDKIIKEMESFSTNSAIAADAQKILTNAIEQADKAMEDESADIEEVSSILSKKYEKALEKAGADVKRLRGILEEESKGTYDNIRNNIDKAQSNWNNFINSIKTVQQVQQVVNLIGALGQLASAIMTLTNIKNIISDESLSSGEKFLQIISAIAMALPMFISGVTAAGRSLVGFAATLKVVESAEVGVGAATTAMINSFWPLLVIGGIIAGVVISIKRLTEAYLEDEIAAEKAAKRVEELTDRYNECKKAAEELKSSISNYDNAIEALEDLEKGTDEYKEALKRANDEAKELIETYKLFDDYEVDPETGIFKIKDEALKRIQEENQKQADQVAANLYSANIASNQANLRTKMTDLSRDFGGVIDIKGGGVVDLTDDMLLSFAKLMQEANENISYKDNDELRQFLLDTQKLDDSFKISIDTLIHFKKSLLDLAETQDYISESNEYFVKQMSKLSIEDRYGEILSQISNGDENRYQLLSSALTQIMTEAMENEEKSLENLSIDRSRYKSKSALKENYGIDVNDLTDLSREYLKSIRGYSDEELKSTDISIPWWRTSEEVTFTTEDGESFSATATEMAKTLAENAERTKLLEEALVSLGDSANESFKKLVISTDEFGREIGGNFTNAVIAGIANESESFDFSSLVNELSIRQLNDLKDKAGGEVENWAEILGISEEDFSNLGNLTANKFNEAFNEGIRNLDDTAIKERFNRIVNESEELTRTLIEGVQLGDINYENLYENEDWEKLINYLEDIKDEYPEIDAAVDVLNKNWETGTQKYIEALENVQDKLSELNFQDLMNKAEEAATKANEELNKIQDINGDILIDADTSAFEEAINELMEANYQIDIAIHTEAEQEFDSIMNAMDDIYNKADMIGESFIVAAGDIRELNNTFPGIIENMTALGDGTIQLNEDIARSAINAAQTEVAADADAAISKLDTQAKLLRAKQTSYENMAKAARILAGTEVDTEMTATDAKAVMSAELANLKKLNSSVASESEMNNAVEVVENSRLNSEILASNWAGAWKIAAEKSAQFAKDAINNMKAAVGEGEATVGNYEVNYKGATGVSGEASILEETQKNLDSASNTSHEVWAKMAEQYKNLADSAGASANDIEGMIAQIGARGHELGTAFDNIRSGYGSGGPKDKGGKTKEEKVKDPDLIDYLEDEKDRYHDVNLELEELEVNLSRLDKQQKKLYGKDLIRNLNEQLDILEKQKATYKEKLNIAREEQKELRDSLSSQGVTFDSDGYISNYASTLQSKLNYTNSIIAQYNAMSAEEQEGFKDTVEAAKEDYDKFKDEISRYDELISSFIPDIEDSIQDAIDQEIEINIQKFTMEVEIRLDMGEAEREFNEFKRKVVDGIKDTDIVDMARSQLKDYTSYFDTEGIGIGPVQKLTQQINDTMAQVRQIDDTGWASAYGDNKNQAMEDLEKYYDELRSQLEDIVDLVDEIKESYLKMIDEAVDAFDKQVDQYEYIKDLLDHDMNVIGLVYGDKAYAQMAQYYNQIEKNNNQELDFLKKRTAYAEEMMNKETNPEAKKKWEEEWMNSLEKLNKKVEDSIQNIIDKYQNAINLTFDKLNKKVTGGLGLDYVSDEWDLINKNADQYLDSINAMYGIQKLENKYLNALDNTDSLAAQQKLNDLMNEQLAQLREKDKLTQYDVDRANMLYEIALKEIALQEAQQNKSQLRLRRDAQGNYSYQFVSDEDKIAEAQEELLTARNDLYNFDKEKYKENLNEIYEYYVEFQEKYAEIMSDMSLTDEERQQRAKLLQEQYGQLINGLVEQNETIKQNLYESTFDALEGLYDADAESFKAMTGKDIDAFRDLTDSAKDLIIGDLIPHWNSGVQHMADTFAGEGGLLNTCKDAFEELDQTTQDYKNSLDDLESAAGVDFDSIASGYDINISKAQELLYANDDLINKYMEEIDAILEVISQLDDLIAKYKSAQDAAVAATEAAYKFVTAQKEAAAAAASLAASAISSSPGNTGASNSGGGSGGSSGGDIGGQSDSGNGDGGDGVPNVGDVVTYTGGLYYYDSYGTNPSGSRGPGKKVTITNINEGAPKPIHVQSNDSAYGWLTLDQLSGYDTGGYTGDWNTDEGKLAILHKKELVLKDTDTENVLTAVSIVRDMAGMLNNINENLLDRLLNLSSSFSSSIGRMTVPSNIVEQDVHIDAKFEGVQDAHEIEIALSNLVNIAAQRAFRNKK